jgi:hypothetical protein
MSDIEEAQKRDEALEIANTIFHQIGGRQFAMMTGAREMTAFYAGLRFNLPASEFNADKIRKVEIELHFGSDTYTMRFYKLRVAEPFKIIERVHCDELQDLFERATGLLTYMHPSEKVKFSSGVHHV